MHIGKNEGILVVGLWWLRMKQHMRENMGVEDEITHERVYGS